MSVTLVHFFRSVFGCCTCRSVGIKMEARFMAEGTADSGPTAANSPVDRKRRSGSWRSRLLVIDYFYPWPGCHNKRVSIRRFCPYSLRKILSFAEKIGEQDGTDSIHCQAWSSRISKMAQPDLDFIGKCSEGCGRAIHHRQIHRYV